MRCLAQRALFTQEQSFKITKCAELVGLGARLTDGQIANTKKQILTENEMDQCEASTNQHQRDFTTQNAKNT